MTGPVAVVMVGGRGERLRPLTDNVPKPLLSIAGETIVERILRRLAEAGITDVWLTVNYLAHAFEDVIGDGSALGLHVRYLNEQTPLGTAGALALLPRAQVTGPVVVTNGDLITSMDFAALLAHHAESGAALTVCGVEYDTQVPYGVLRTADERLLGIDEKPTRTDLVSAGMYVVGRELLDLVPAGASFGMPDLMEAALAAGLPVGVHRVTEDWYDIGSHDEFHRVSRLLESDGTADRTTTTSTTGTSSSDQRAEERQP